MEERRTVMFQILSMGILFASQCCNTSCKLGNECVALLAGAQVVRKRSKQVFRPVPSWDSTTGDLELPQKSWLPLIQIVSGSGCCHAHNRAREHTLRVAFVKTISALFGRSDLSTQRGHTFYPSCTNKFKRNVDLLTRLKERCAFFREL